MLRGVLLDLDGTVWQGGRLIPGAANAIATMRGAGLRLLFATNITRRPRSVLANELAELGIPASPEECLTAPAAAARWLEARGAERISPLVAEASLEDLAAFTIDHDAPEYVLVADLGPGWTFQILDRAFRALMNGAKLVAIQRNRYWRPETELTLDAGPFVAALEYASGQEAEIVGKPSAAFFHSACAALGLEPATVAMVGDDLEADIEGARAAGLRSVGVRTGKYRIEDEAAFGATADVVLDSIRDLPQWASGG